MKEVVEAVWEKAAQECRHALKPWLLVLTLLVYLDYATSAVRAGVMCRAEALSGSSQSYGRILRRVEYGARWVLHR